MGGLRLQGIGRGGNHHALPAGQTVGHSPTYIK